METCSVVLTFESVDEILWCDHSNETSSAVLLYGNICFSIFYKILEFFLNFDVPMILLPEDPWPFAFQSQVNCRYACPQWRNASFV